jgi:hypothetical protein
MDTFRTNVGNELAAQRKTFARSLEADKVPVEEWMKLPASDAASPGWSGYEASYVKNAKATITNECEAASKGGATNQEILGALDSFDFSSTATSQVYTDRQAARDACAFGLARAQPEEPGLLESINNNWNSLFQ